MQPADSNRHCSSINDFVGQLRDQSKAPGTGGALWSLLEANQDYLEPGQTYEPEGLQVLEGIAQVLQPGAEENSKQAALMDKVSRILKGAPELDPVTFNSQPDVPMSELGLENPRMLWNFVREHGESLTALNLVGFEITDKQAAALFKQCPHVEYVQISSEEFTGAPLKLLADAPVKRLSLVDCYQVTDETLAGVRGMKLEELTLAGCEQITDAAFDHLEGMPLKRIDLLGCELITDAASEKLTGLKLQEVDFSSCWNVTDKTLENLKDMPLKRVAFHECYYLTDDGLQYLKGKELVEVDFGLCGELTDEGMKNFEGMQLEIINFNSCMELTLDGIKVFEGMPLQQVNLRSCPNIEEEHVQALVKN